MNRNRRIICLKRIATVAVCFSLTAVSALPAMAAESPKKQENVYASLTEDGTVEGIYVVNEYDLEQDTKITDYGDYTEVTNLSSEEKITEDGNEYTVEGKKGKFYYQGNLESKDLPWEIAISYYLNGEKMTAEDLAGKSGSLEIRISVSRNEAAKGDYFDNYLLQTTVTLDSEKCKNIQATDATMANVGSDKQILYNIMAGQEKEMSITAEVTDFEMDGIAFQGVPMSFAIDTDRLELSELYDRTDELKGATAELDDGASELKKGTEGLANGSGQLLEAVKGLTGGTGSLVSGAGSLTEGASQLKNGTIAYTTGVDSYIDGTQQYMNGVNSLHDGAKQLEELENLGQVSQGASQLSSSAQQLLTGAEDLSNGLGALKEQLHAFAGMANAEEELYAEAERAEAQIDSAAMELAGQVDSVNSQISAANESLSFAAAATNSQIDQAIAFVAAAMENGAIDEAAGNALMAGMEGAKVQAQSVNSVSVVMPDTEGSISGNIAGELDGSELSSMGNLSQLIKSVDALKDGSDQLETGVSQMSQGLAVMEAQTASLPEAAKGIGSLLEGFETLTAKNDALMEGSSTLKVSSGALNQGAETVHSGAGQLDTGVTALSSGAAAFESGVTNLANGAEELDNGAAQMKEGTAKFCLETSDIDSEIEDEISRMIEKFSGKDYIPVSFASDKNINTEAVQFAFQTDPISVKEEIAEVAEEEPESFRDKVKGLFE